MSANNRSAAMIIGISNTGETVCAASARISTQQGNALEILEKSTDNRNNSKLVSKVLKSGHSSVIEHTYFNLAFSDVSVMVEQFMIEFRLASFTVKSRRYVDFSSVGYVTPELPQEPWTNAYQTAYAEHMDCLFSAYENLLSHGVPKEDARFVLPYCYRSNFYCSANAREFMHILRAMLYGRGKKYPEIFHLGKKLLTQAKELCPGIFENFENACANYDDTFSLDFINLPQEKEMPQEKVELLQSPVNAAQTAAKAVLITQTQLPSRQIDELLHDKNKVSEIIRRLIKNGRPRELETLNYTFRFNGISLAGVTHVVRHRLQSVCVPSLKYTNRANHVIPATISSSPELLECYQTAFRKNLEIYQALQKQGVPEEMLVYFCLSGNTLDLVTTMNARELLLFLRLRTCMRAQWEVRSYALEMLRKLRGVSPEIFNSYGASCYLEGKCPEGALTCGKFAEMQEFFKTIL